MKTTENPVLRASLLVYDIPERLRFPNPSGYLRRRAVRINLSAWIVPHGNEPNALLDRMTKVGVSWKMNKFDPSDAANLLETCIDALKTDIVKRMKQAGASVRNATVKAAAGVDAKKECRLFAKRTGGTLNRMRKLLADFDHVARTFGIDADRQLSLPAALTAVDAMSASVKTRSELYAQAAADLRELGTVDAVALASAAEIDQCPWYAMADFLDEHGGDGAALRQAFAAV